ncbi:unnamed protein product [Paramecium octaurelia]|uniref:Tetratricopeptide repeat protein n=1 Tax=Paramecium octaurelia TaxID=43137 RepID=A0A8S1UAR8_PAROT|nr:unnamed protein product [Paramecium octaurelia]
MSSQIFDDDSDEDGGKYGSKEYIYNTDNQNFSRAAVHLKFGEKNKAQNILEFMYQTGIDEIKNDKQRALYIFNELTKQKTSFIKSINLYFAKVQYFIDNRHKFILTQMITLKQYRVQIKSLKLIQISIPPKYIIQRVKITLSLGISHFKLNQNIKALQDFEKVKLKKDEIEDKENLFLLRGVRQYLTIGNLYLQANKLDEALQDFNEAVILLPDISECWYKRGKVFELMEYYERSIEDYRKAISLAPQDPLSSASLGQLFFLLKDHKQAQIYLEMAETNLLNLTSSTLAVLNLTQENVKYIKLKVKLLQNINTGLNQIKDEMYMFTKNNTLYSQESSEYAQKISQCEIQIKNSLRNSSFEGTSQSSSDILQLCQKISQEVQQLSEKIRMLEQQQRINQNQIQILMEQEPFVIQQELIQLEKSDNMYLYYRSVFWRLYNYLQAMSLISTNLIQFNSDTLIETNSEKILNILQTVVNVSNAITGFIPIVGAAFNIINSALDFGVEQMKNKKFKNRMMNLASILQRFAVTPSELEREIQFASIYLAKSLQVEPYIDQQSKYYSFIIELSRQEGKFEKNAENPYWKKGVEHSLIILKYLEDNCQRILQTQQKMNLRAIIVEAISIADQKIKTFQQINYQRDIKVQKQQCCQIQ